LSIKECTDCGRLSLSGFNSSASLTFSEVPCGQCATKSVCDGGRCTQTTQIQDLSTWSGYEVRDHAFHGGGGHPENIIGTDAAVSFGFQFQFFCLKRVRGYFEKSVKNGILGMSPAPTSFVNQMYFAGKLKKPRFSLCFNEKKSLGNGNKNTGVVTFGGYEASFIDTEMVYTKKLSDPNKDFSYKVNITRLHFRLGGGVSIRTKEAHTYIAVTPGHDVNTEAVLDSSVPFLSLDKRWESHFTQAWKKATGRSFSYERIELTLAQLDLLPTLVIEIEVSS
jgi:Xylanase inhibitor N-terminal